MQEKNTFYYITLELYSDPMEMNLFDGFIMSLLQQSLLKKL